MRRSKVLHDGASAIDINLRRKLGEFGCYCFSGKTGRCARRDDLCRDENELWVERCPRGFYCDSRRYCKRDDGRGGSGSLSGDRDRNRDRDRNGGDGYCSLLNPCRSGRTCCSDGTCSRSRSCTCSRSNSRGSCPLGEECESRGGRGSCRRIRCSRRSSCPEGFECRNGECREDRDYLQSSAIDFPDRRDRDQECSSRNRFGYITLQTPAQFSYCILTKYKYLLNYF